MDNVSVHPEIAARLRQIANTIDDPGGPKAIDWAHLRELIADLLTKYGPILIPLILSLLTAKPPARPEA
jgi:hypothetical protein